MARDSYVNFSVLFMQNIGSGTNTTRPRLHDPRGVQKLTKSMVLWIHTKEKLNINPSMGTVTTHFVWVSTNSEVELSSGIWAILRFQTLMKKISTVGLRILLPCSSIQMKFWALDKPPTAINSQEKNSGQL